MITLTGFDRAMSDSLCEIFTPIFELFTHYVPSGVSCFECKKEQNRGRPWMIWLEDGLGLFFSMDQNKGFVDGFAANFWDDIYQP
jgi:hypothetical protein